ncbi:hypothetical protein DICVIV_06234 [Dictyocaulus viviparus]|uniref:Uncharacterized protein n=1 Tax=Dictyocaulus viviparus TaxID=29172 RepID=A0A0D8XV04_DICVI|nr:hypothetical protein DICVIV_06234 [Dictyocaulus viviparus]
MPHQAAIQLNAAAIHGKYNIQLRKFRAVQGMKTCDEEDDLKYDIPVYGRFDIHDIPSRTPIGWMHYYGCCMTTSLFFAE